MTTQYLPSNQLISSLDCIQPRVPLMQKVSAKLRRFAPRTVSSGASKIQSCRKRHVTVMEMTRI